MRTFLVCYLTTTLSHTGDVIQLERRVRLHSLQSVARLVMLLGTEWKEVAEEPKLYHGQPDTVAIGEIIRRHINSHVRANAKSIR